MKKHLLTLSLTFIVITAIGQISIPNGNFESWIAGTYDFPRNYDYNSNPSVFLRSIGPFNLEKSTDAYSGNYAVQLTTVANALDTAMGYFVNIDPEDGDPFTWTGGFAYDQVPTGIKGYYKYNVATADSALLIVAFSQAGVNVGAYFFKLGGIQSSYTLFDFVFTPALSLTPDSVVFGVLSSNVFVDDDGVAGSVLLIDSVAFTGVASQPALFNGDFEDWDSTTIYYPENWNIDGGGMSTFAKTSDAAAGDYALQLTTLIEDRQGVKHARPGEATTGYWNKSCDCLKGGFPFTEQIDTLALSYKYSPADTADSARVRLAFKLNDTIFYSHEEYLLASANYQYFEYAFNLPQAPDTVIITLLSTHNYDTLLTSAGAVLIIDEIHFKSQPLNTGIFKMQFDDVISIYPNPSNGRFIINGLYKGFRSLDIYNVNGQNVYSEKGSAGKSTVELDVSGLPQGMYFIKIFDGEKYFSEKIVIQ